MNRFLRNISRAYFVFIMWILTCFAGASVALFAVILSGGQVTLTEPNRVIAVIEFVAAIFLTISGIIVSLGKVKDA